jgi:leucyl-tRNA synthetase
MFSEFGESVFEETSAFDEMQTLEENTSYLISTLDLEGLDIQYSDKAEERIQEECCPGGPYIVFRREESIPLLIINEQANKPYFELEVPIYKGDCVERVAERIRKENRLIKGLFCFVKALLFSLIFFFSFFNRFI